MGNYVLTLTKDNFEKEVLQSDIPVLVDFWATWCGPCKMIAPVIDQIAEEFHGKIKVGKINVDEQQELTGEYRVMTIPNLMVFKGGKVVDSLIGYRQKEELADMLNKHL